MPHTLVLRSSDRVDPTSKTNDFWIRTGMDAAFNDHTMWRVCVKQIVLPPKSVPFARANGAWSVQTNGFVNSGFVETRLTFGTSTKSYDSRIKGSQIVHFEPSFSTNNANPAYIGAQHGPVYFDIGRPNSTEIRIQLFDDQGAPLVLYDTSGASANSQDLGEWVIILQLEELGCH